MARRLRRATRYPRTARLVAAAVGLVFTTCAPRAEEAREAALGIAFDRAVDAVIERQSPGGYWLTLHTPEPSFLDPIEELNNYTPALILDLLEPVAEPLGLSGPLESTRSYLSAQVDARGLVRYLGPRHPGSKRPCATITPDADDTALVWRLAPPAEGELFERALGTLDAYRTPAGLYRTWLAERDDYVCIDPGADPNPPDIGIQMHVFQLLAERRTAEAGRLCAAIARTIAEDELWVYYAATPIVPLVRTADLALHGCRAEVPESRLEAPVPGQDGWIETARRLRDALHPDTADPHREAVVEHLATMAADGFAIVERAPPLVYHNDLSASRSRYYWSPEVGYALWIRLYCETLGCSRSPAAASSGTSG